MKRLSAKEYILPFVLTFGLGILIDVLLLPMVTYTGAQKYRDIIYGLADLNTNKSAELTLFKVSLVAICLIVILFIRKAKLDSASDSTECSDKHMAFYAVIAMNVGYFFIFGRINEKIVIASLFFFFCSYLYAEKSNTVFLLGICSYYTVTAFVSATSMLMQRTDKVLWRGINQAEIFILTAILVLLVLLIWKKTNDSYLNKIILSEQILIPLNLCVFRKNLYMYGEDLINISFPSLYKWVIAFVCIAGVGVAFIHFFIFTESVNTRD